MRGAVLETGRERAGMGELWGDRASRCHAMPNGTARHKRTDGIRPEQQDPAGYDTRSFCKSSDSVRYGAECLRAGGGGSDEALHVHAFGWVSPRR